MSHFASCSVVDSQDKGGGGGVEGGLLPLRASVGLKIKDGGGRASLLDLPRDFSEIENLLAG